MENTHNHLLLEQYLRGELSDHQVIEIQTRIQTDSAFAKLYEELKNIQEGIRFSNLKATFETIQSWELLVEKERNKNFEQEVENAIRLEHNLALLKTIKTYEKDNQQPIRKLPIFWWGLAASVILGISILLYTFSNSSISEAQQLMSVNFTAYPIIGTDRGKNLPEIKKSAIENYLSENFDKSIPNFKELAAFGDSLAIFYLGIAQLGDLAFDNSIQTLQTFDQQYNSLKTPTHWYLGLNYLAKENFQQADFYLDLVAKENGFKAAEAKKLQLWIAEKSFSKD